MYVSLTVRRKHPPHNTFGQFIFGHARINIIRRFFN
jgi:CheY-like chemotaxis protein